MHVSTTGPEVDEVSDLRGRSANLGQEVMYRLSRQLDTGDVEQDFVIDSEVTFELVFVIVDLDGGSDQCGRVKNVTLPAIGVPLWWDAEYDP